MSTYFTRIDINTRRRNAVRLLASPNRVHGAMLQCFPPSQSPKRPLWRLDRTAAGTSVYLVSDVAPDPTGFVEEYGWPVAGGWETRDYAVVLGAVQTGARFAFRLTANPTHAVMLQRTGDQPKSMRGKRLAHTTADQQLRWLVAKGPGFGFHVGSEERSTVQVVERRVLKFKRQSRDVTIGTATYEGELVVADAEQLRRRLVEGIGPAKAYGCGLLTLARLR